MFFPFICSDIKIFLYIEIYSGFTFLIVIFDSRYLYLDMNVDRKDALNREV